MRTDRVKNALWTTAAGFRMARILLTAVELDVFTDIGNARKSAAEVAEEAGTDARATEVLLNALVAMGYLKKKAGRFSNTAVSRRHLVKGSEDYLGGPLGHSNYLWMTWSQLTKVVRSGKPAEVEAPDYATESFIMAMAAGARETAPVVADVLDFAGVRRLLDLGGGPGTFAIEFAGRNPGLEAVVFDRPDVVPIARRVIAAAGMSERVRTAAGNFLHDDIGSGYDLVFVSSIIHSYGAEQNRLILRKAHDALNPGGQVVVRDFIMEEGKTKPASGAIFAINMLVNTDSGATYSEIEVRQWLEECAFENIVRKDIGTDGALLIGRRR